MLKSLKIENFRGFPSFELNKLGRINLLVGKNNSGKTTVLERV
jgi:AAA15 family ATPase/GTPase